MATDKSSNIRDCDLTLRLEYLFHEYVALYTKLYKDGGENSGVPDERIEMVMKLESANHEMSELLMQWQMLNSDAELVANVVPQTISASKRSSAVSSRAGT
jgi:hypothetical protein